MQKDNETFLGLGVPVDNRPSSDANQIIEQLKVIDGIELPQNKKQIKALARAVQNASEDSPLTIYVGSCPDYSHQNGLYTHESVGEDIPLLTNKHLQEEIQILQILDGVKVPYQYVVMIADAEAIDEVFVAKFANGNPNEFLDKCYSSAAKTQDKLDMVKASNGLEGSLRSSSFFKEFGYDRFMTIQQAYQDVLHQRYIDDGSFRARVNTDITTRRQMYQRMYDKVLSVPGVDYLDFLVGRDLRTKAQYLALGNCISADSQNAIVINHPTTNIGMFNDRNRYLLPGEQEGTQRAIPVCALQDKIY